MKNGIHRMTTDEYNLVKRSRWSRAKYILECPEVYMHKLKTEDNATRSKSLGSLVHAMVLEPETVEDEFFRATKVDRRTKAGKAAWAEQQEAAEGKDLIEAAVYDQGLDLSALLMKEMNRQLPGWRDGQKELSVLSSMYRVPAKCRIDLFHEGKIWDIKTTKSLRQRSFVGACDRYAYYGQMATYRKMLSNYEKGVEIGGLIVVQTVGAPMVKVLPFSEEAKRYGTEQAQKAWSTLEKCKAESHWPGYDYSELGIPE